MMLQANSLLLALVMWVFPLDSYHFRILDKFLDETKLAQVGGFLELSCPGRNNELIKIDEHFQLKIGNILTCRPPETQSQDHHVVSEVVELRRFVEVRTLKKFKMTPKTPNESTRLKTEICFHQKKGEISIPSYNERAPEEFSFVCLKTGEIMTSLCQALRKHRDTGVPSTIPILEIKNKKQCAELADFMHLTQCGGRLRIETEKEKCGDGRKMSCEFVFWASPFENTTRREQILDGNCTSGFTIDLNSVPRKDIKIACFLRNGSNTIIARWQFLSTHCTKEDCGKSVAAETTLHFEHELTKLIVETECSNAMGHDVAETKQGNSNNGITTEKTTIGTGRDPVQVERDEKQKEDDDLTFDQENDSNLVLAGVVVGGSFALILVIVLAFVVVRRIKREDSRRAKRIQNDNMEYIEELIQWGPKKGFRKTKISHGTLYRGSKAQQRKAEKIAREWENHMKIGPLQRWKRSENHTSSNTPMEILRSPKESIQPVLCAQSVANNHNLASDSPREALLHLLNHFKAEILAGILGVKIEESCNLDWLQLTDSNSADKISSKYGSETGFGESEENNCRNLSMFEQAGPSMI